MKEKKFDMLKMSVGSGPRQQKTILLLLVLLGLELLKFVVLPSFGRSQIEFLWRTVPALLRICESIDFTT